MPLVAALVARDAEALPKYRYGGNVGEDRSVPSDGISISCPIVQLQLQLQFLTDMHTFYSVVVLALR